MPKDSPVSLPDTYREIRADFAGLRSLLKVDILYKNGVVNRARWIQVRSTEEGSYATVRLNKPATIEVRRYLKIEPEMPFHIVNLIGIGTPEERRKRYLQDWHLARKVVAHYGLAIGTVRLHLETFVDVENKAHLEIGVKPAIGIERFRSNLEALFGFIG